MTAPAALLAQARAAGLTFATPEPGALKLIGDPAAVARWTPILRPHKADLLTLLADRQEAVAEATAERAAIMEHDGGLPRVRAREIAEQAGQFYAHHWSCPACRAGTLVGAGLHRPCPEGAALWVADRAAAGREVRP